MFISRDKDDLKLDKQTHISLLITTMNGSCVIAQLYFKSLVEIGLS